MPRTLKHEGALVVELPAHPCARPDDLDRVKTQLIEAGRKSPRLIIDLTPVRWIQGMLLSALVSTWTTLGARRGDIVVIADDNQREVFRVTRLDALFVVCGSRDEAVRAPWPPPAPLVAWPVTSAAS